MRTVYEALIEMPSAGHRLVDATSRETYVLTPSRHSKLSSLSPNDYSSLSPYPNAVGLAYDPRATTARKG